MSYHLSHNPSSIPPLPGKHGKAGVSGRMMKRRWNRPFITGRASGGVPCSMKPVWIYTGKLNCRETSSSALKAVCRETRAVGFYRPIIATGYLLVSAVQLSFRGLNKWQGSTVKVHGWKVCLIRYRGSYLWVVCVGLIGPKYCDKHLCRQQSSVLVFLKGWILQACWRQCKCECLSFL